MDLQASGFPGYSGGAPDEFGATVLEHVPELGRRVAFRE